jgi:uncharacterized membrane protein (UPF0127 family)
MLALLFTFTAFLGFIACDGTSDAESPAVLQTRDITVSGDDVETGLTVELATTSEERQEGLMFRQAMDDDRGMLFLFPEVQGEGHGFWMRNTYIPLTIAYLTRAARCSCSWTASPGRDHPARSALLRRARSEPGLVRTPNLGVGSVVELPDDAPAPD